MSDTVHAVSTAITAATTAGQFLPLTAWHRREGRTIEGQSQDAVVTVRATMILDGATIQRFARLGPAGSKARFAVGDFLTIDYRCDFIGGAVGHSDPNTGAFSAPAPTFSGAGLNDMSSGGTYSGTGGDVYLVTVDTAAAT